MTELDSALLAEGLAALFAEGAILTDRRKLNNPPTEYRYLKGHTRNPLYSIDECAVIHALKVLGVTQTGIQQLTKRVLPNRPNGSCHATIRRILSGTQYAAIRRDPVFLKQLEHYIQFFEGTMRQQPGWTPGAKAFEMARAAAAGKTGKTYASSQPAMPAQPLQHFTAESPDAARRAEQATAARAAARAASLAQ